MKTRKISLGWLWVLIILLLGLIGLAIYFLFQSGPGASSIPQPPALPI